jgi:hypothetical protein
MNADSPETAPQALKRPWWLFAAILALGIGLRIWLSAATDFTIGDAFILFRFAEQFAAGHGLVFNTGEWVGGNTSLLHSLLMGSVAWTGVGVPLAARLVGIACDVGTLVLVWNIFRGPTAVRSPLLQMAAPAVIFLCPLLFFYSVSGMETPLYILLIFLVLDRTLKKLDWRWYLAVGLAFFCRPDSVVVVGFALLFTWLTTRKIPWQAASGTVVLGLVYLGFNYIAYRSFIPLSVKVKAVVYHKSFAENFHYIADRFFFHRSWLLAGGLALLLLAVVLRRKRPAVLLLGLTTFGYLLFDISAPYLRTWYVVPFLTLFICTLLLAVATWAEDVRLPRLEPITLGALGVYLLASAYADRVLFRECGVWRARIRDLTEAAGTWVKDNTPPDAKIFVTALETGYFAKRHTWDWPGLVAPQVLQMIKAEPNLELLEIADRLKVDYAVLPNDLQTNGHPSFRQLKVCGTSQVVGRMGAAETGYIIYQRVNPATSPK